uniref:Serine aminopeptidase S33 domain-containing protein n=1 Tax=Pyrodinium bahamense TaxID=73915 RepID=A0A7S0B987_9DINO|mmetsp:Transcript_6144/g.16693  ORF Transcript_6144/g.16693 Transcript_6144/m.16693 type:complete len:404 (+) Transcript_6144:57-1268(+)|eukprot:CAMPEP_0179026746 /NCGR_PEP_ID=MMETSP0796-20121207/8679_1 /TAXON_ID=73915 /ORGANISM="Pyrodinium bahamense, Strain pbaha01" /LENGTH=403 /DNA_ID=CAMNT_0020722847 /DNA_START=25 /DNA_END=1236 /DNA_ORIENTATION=-
MAGGSAAPDVDLKSRGVPRYVVVGGLAVVIVVFLLGRNAQRESEGSDEVSSPYWLLWLMVWGLVRLIQLCLGLVLLLLVVLVARQRSIIYVPTPPGTQRSPSNNPYGYRSPATWSLPYEDAWVFAEDGTRLHAWLVYQDPEKWTKEEAPYTLVYFHGNAGNIGHRLENVKDMHKKLRINILIVDYRGYGDSEDGGGPCESGFLMDAIATYRWLVERMRNPPSGQHAKMSADRILLFGRSIGGSVAIRLFAQLFRMHLRASDRTALPLPAGLILENTFTSLRDMAVQVFPFLRIVSLLLRSPIIFDEWRAAESLEFLSRHYEHWCCCLLSGLQDEIVPPSHMRQLHEILKENRPKVLKYFRFPHGGHNDTPNKGGEEYWKSWEKYMDLVTETEAERIRERDALN